MTLCRNSTVIFLSLTPRWTSRWWTACGSNAQTSSHRATRSQKRTTLQLCHVKPAHTSHRFWKVTGFRRACEQQVPVPCYLLTSVFTHSHRPLFHNFLPTSGLSLWKTFLFSNNTFKHRLPIFTIFRDITVHQWKENSCQPAQFDKVLIW